MSMAGAWSQADKALVAGTRWRSVHCNQRVPYLDDEGRQAYREFLSEPSPKFFVISPVGVAASFNSGFDPLGRAMRACADRAQHCQVYAADNDVTWVAVPLNVKLD